MNCICCLLTTCYAGQRINRQRTKGGQRKKRKTSADVESTSDEEEVEELEEVEEEEDDLFDDSEGNEHFDDTGKAFLYSDNDEGTTTQQASGRIEDEEAPSARGFTEAQILQQAAMAETIMQEQMTKDGMLETAKQERDRVASIVRSELFKKVKFCVPSLMKTGGRVAMKIYKYMGAEEYSSSAEYTDDWETWIRKHVRNSLNEKRSAVNQSVHKSLVRSKW